MLAIFKREISAYFKSPIGYVFIAVCFLFSGAFFYLFALSSGSTDLASVFSGMFFVLMIFIPTLTMRLVAEDNRQKTDQLTLTAPVSVTGIVFGKFLAAFVIFMSSVIIMLIYGIVLSAFATINWSIIIGNVIAMTLLGGTFVAVGLMISTMTENQMIACIGSIAANLALLLIDTLASIIPIDFISNAIGALSFYGRYNEFSYGLFNIANVVFFLSAIFVFLFITTRIIEKRRWS